MFGDLAYRIEPGGVSWEPFANLAHVRLRTDSFTERGGQAALSANKDTAETTFATLGVRPSMQVDLGSMRTTLRGMVGWRHAFGDVVPTSAHAFAGGDSFAVRGAPLARDAAALEASADFALGQRGVASITYGGQLGDGVTDQRLRADIRITF